MTCATDRLDAIKKEFPEILERCHGNITLTCKNVGIAKDTFYKWYHADPEFKAACLETKETTKDFVENQLLKRIADQDTTSIIFFLKTQAKDRGYVERTETTGKDGGAIKTEHILKDLSKEQIDSIVRIGKGD